VRVWTNGKITRAWTEKGHFRVEPRGRSRHVVVETVPDRKRSYASYLNDDVGVWDDDLGERLDERVPLPSGAILDLRRWGEERVAAAVAPEGDHPPELVVAPVDGESPELVLKLEGAPKTKVEFPAKDEGWIWSKDAVPWPKSEGFGDAEASKLNVRTSRYGVGVAGSSTGHVAVLRPGAEDFAFRFRVPAMEESTVYAVPTKWGALVALVVDGKESLLLHVDPKGKLLGRWPEESCAMGMTAPVLLGDDRCIANDAESESVVLLGLPKLEQVARKKVGEWLVDIAATSDGTKFAAVTKTDVVEGRVSGDAIKVRTHSLTDAMKQAKKERVARKEKEAKRWKAKPADGPPQLGFDALKRPAPPWKWSAGEDWEVDAWVRSEGRAAKGVTIVVYGAAVDAGLLELFEVHVAGICGVFEKQGKRWIAQVPDVEVMQGVKYPFDPKPKKEEEKLAAQAALEATHLALRLKGKALTKGNGLLKLEISTEGPEPMRWIRPVNVG